MRGLWFVFLLGCGNHSDRPSAGDDDPQADAAMEIDASIDAPACEGEQSWCTDACVDLQTSNDHCGDCTTSCDADATCVAGTCKPGAPHAATGTCVEIDQPGWLSCPTGMSCQCYFHYYKKPPQPGSLKLWLGPNSVEVQGGMLPQNTVLTSAPAATVMLMTNAMTGVKTGASYPYTVTIGATGAIEVKLRDSDGYIPEKFVKQTDADCGNRGQILECTFN